ncbi:MAG: N-acetylmuramoyl-L-alanine amidase CwlD [Ruminococcaceae bacterium]|nr:N-acetylmuramoyl-L-alanine amidase CwlD [Oscillospiraceae bacterium]
MIIFIKKWNGILLAAVLLLAVCGIGLALRPESTAATFSVPGYGSRIVLDAGHGEPDGGAEGESGVLEKDLNLAIARFLQEYLEQSGAEVIMTRTDDNGLFDLGSRTIRQKKRTDLYERERIMNESGADLFVSIHMNKFTDAKYSGPQVFYAPNGEASKRLSEILQQEMISILQPKSQREVKKAGKDIYLLKQAKLPAVLIECGFLSNREEEQRLLSEDYQKRIAWSIYCGIVRYLEET